MCVAQFRDYCKASRFQIDKKFGGEISMQDDLQNKNVQVGQYIEYKNEDGKVYQSVYYRTDLKQLKKLAKSGNSYARKHLENLSVEK